jgi:hypothetical protein
MGHWHLAVTTFYGSNLFLVWPGLADHSDPALWLPHIRWPSFHKVGEALLLSSQFLCSHTSVTHAPVGWGAPMYF